MSERAARAASERVDELMGKGLTEPDAMARVAADTEEAAARHARQANARIVAAARVQQLAESHADGLGPGTRALLARDLRQRATYSNVEGRARAIRGLAHAEMVDVLDRFRAKFIGLFTDTRGLEEFVRSLYGASRSGEMNALTKAWSSTVERLRTRFEAAGGYLPALDTWRLPQVWDDQAVRRAGKGEFNRYMQDALGRGALVIRDLDTGEPVRGARADSIINTAYDRIASRGLSDLVPGQAGGAGALANGRSAPRAFAWQSAEAWLDANRRFGAGDAGIFDLLNGHIDGMSRDIAMIEILGPNPEWTVRMLTDRVRQADPARADVEAGRIQRLWDTVTGAAASPEAEWLATAGREIRAWLSASQLGSALLSSFSDFSTLRQAASWNGLSNASALGRYVRLMNPLDDTDRRMAVRAGLIADGWAQRAIGAQRFNADVVGAGLGTRAADLVMRLSLLSPHTQASRWAFGMEFLGRLADDAGQSFDQLDAPLRRAFETYGMGAAEWDVIRARGLWSQDGVRLISPDEMARAGDADVTRVATQLLEMVQTETRFAIPEAGAAERAAMMQGSRAGTWGGEAWRAFMQYKAFPVTVMTMQLGRGLNAARQGDFGRYLATLAVTMTMAGALAMQAKQIAQGRDPRDMQDWRFWGAAFAQGGAAGILGDFLYTGLSRADQGLVQQMMGPTFGLADDIASFAGLNVQSLVGEREERSFGNDLARFVRRNTPGTSLWYARLTMDRLMWDELQQALDPNAHRRWRTLERRALRDFNQEFWWRPGETAPEREPAWPRQ
jgi:uncharacterized protein YoaH (UPF0181 family)